jgi:hypothetical protein
MNSDPDRLLDGLKLSRNFLEFCGNFFLNAATGQRQIEEMAQWMGQGFAGFEGFTNLFRRCYGLDQINRDDPDSTALWEKAVHDFQASFKGWIGLVGAVPRQEYLALAERHEALKEKVARQEETILHLRRLCQEKLFDPGEMAKGFQDLVQDQSDRFLQFMQDLRQSPSK